MGQNAGVASICFQSLSGPAQESFVFLLDRTFFKAIAIPEGHFWERRPPMTMTEPEHIARIRRLMEVPKFWIRRLAIGGEDDCAAAVGHGCQTARKTCTVREVFKDASDCRRVSQAYAETEDQTEKNIDLGDGSCSRSQSKA